MNKCEHKGTVEDMSYVCDFVGASYEGWCTKCDSFVVGHTVHTKRWVSPSEYNDIIFGDIK